MNSNEWVENLHFLIGKGFEKWPVLYALINKKIEYHEQRILTRLAECCRADERITSEAMTAIMENIEKLKH